MDRFVEDSSRRRTVVGSRHGTRRAVYILTNKRNGTLYVGVTSDLLDRVSQHRSGWDPGSFTARYDLRILVYFEPFDDIEEAIAREKQLKGGSRKQKVALIESMNPQWRDLFAELAREWGYA
ncbi:MAG: GIY-YIG nuclease family protein [Flavobacteriales bacterium]|nr:GIY-YIG nuclease family protein [Flavobacteriales bacterium]